jgi:hypothetical protein
MPCSNYQSIGDLGCGPASNTDQKIWMRLSVKLRPAMPVGI